MKRFRFQSKTFVNFPKNIKNLGPVGKNTQKEYFT